jgi:hypothetical protein
MKNNKTITAILGLTLVAGVFVAIASIPGDERQCNFESPKSSNATSDQVSVILAPTQNFVDFSSIIAKAEIPVSNALGMNMADVLEARGNEISVIMGDSDPQLVVRRVLDPSGTSTGDMLNAFESIERINEKVYECAAASQKIVGDEVPTTAQADFLKALQAAEDQFLTNGSKEIFVLGNGIQTSGAILMQEEGTLPANTGEALRLAKTLKERDQIPNLKGIRVTWVGLGQVDGEYQKALPLPTLKALEVFWAEVVRLSGAEKGDFFSQVGSGVPHINSIPVDLVPVNDCPVTVLLNASNGVEYVANSSDFVSLEDARAAAQVTVTAFEGLKGCSSLTVRGVAAAGVDKPEYESGRAAKDLENLNLTKSRAEAFGKLLLDAGFSGQLEYVGGGTCMTEWDASGLAVPELQRVCRRVEVY